MTDLEFVSYFVGSLYIVYFAGYQWGKYVRILKDLGRAS